MNATASEAQLNPRIVSRTEWLDERKQYLLKEKEHTKARDALSEARRKLPWVKIDKEYVFDAPEGKVKLADLFAGRSQLVIKHFMLGPGWKEGCVGCSFETDHLEAALAHIENHDVSFVLVARAPLNEIESFKQRMGWRSRWVSSFKSDFNYDFHVSFTPEQVARGEVYYNYERRDYKIEELSGLSVFYRNENGEIFHTYSTFGRGAESVMSSYVLLDITPKGRNETGPNFNLTDWVRHHDRYGAKGHVDATGRFVAEKSCEC